LTDILVIDDDPAVVRLVSLILVSGGYDVQRAESGSKGLEVLNSDGPDPSLIVLDLQMPGIDGRAFYKLAREAGYSGPVLILSAYGAHQAREELGAQASLAKPFEPDELLIEVGKLAPV
jgi:two-component system response regulator AtoC